MINSIPRVRTEIPEDIGSYNAKLCINIRSFLSGINLLNAELLYILYPVSAVREQPAFYSSPAQVSQFFSSVSQSGFVAQLLE